VPLLPNFEGKSFLDLLYDTRNMSLLNESLLFLKLYPFDHHSRQMVKLLPKLFKHTNLTNMSEYLDSRIIETEETRRIKRGILKDDGIERTNQFPTLIER
jgi:hypothetical protein